MSYVKQSASFLCAVLVATLLSACGGGGGGGGGGGPITISGIVVNSTGAPVSGANLILNNSSSSLVTTGADGTFSFANVTPPYVLTLKSGTAIAEYRNLTRANPQLTSSILGGVASTATLAGDVTGPTYPLPLGQGIIVGASNGVLPFGVGANSTTGAYSGTFLWAGSASKTTDLVALRATATGPVITAYIQTGTRSGVVLNNGVNQTNLDIALTTAVTTANSIFNYSLGAYASGSAGGRYLTLKAGGATFFLPTSPVIPSGTNLLLPSEGATLVVTGSDASGNSAIRFRSAVLGGTTTLDLPATTALKNSLPANAAINVSKTPALSWTPVSGAEIYLVSLSTGGQSFAFIVPATSASLTVPDYSVLGMALLGATVYNWSVIALQTGALTTDAMTDPAGSGVSLVALFLASTLDWFTSVATSFTTVP
jgi:hypothetical protein